MSRLLTAGSSSRVLPIFHVLAEHSDALVLFSTLGSADGLRLRSLWDLRQQVATFSCNLRPINPVHLKYPEGTLMVRNP